MTVEIRNTNDLNVVIERAQAAAYAAAEQYENTYFPNGGWGACGFAWVDIPVKGNTKLGRMLKAAGVYQLPDLCVVGEAGVVKLQVRDKKNDTSNDFSIIVGETESEFSFNFKVENIKILPGSYTVSISQKLLSEFKCKDRNLKYFIALEPDSTFN